MPNRSTTGRRTCAFGPACIADPDARLRRGQPRYRAPGGVAHRACVQTAADRLAAVRAEITATVPADRLGNTLALSDAFAVALTDLRFTSDGCLLVDPPAPVSTNLELAGGGGMSAAQQPMVLQPVTRGTALAHLADRHNCGPDDVWPDDVSAHTQIPHDPRGHLHTLGRSA